MMSVNKSFLVRHRSSQMSQRGVPPVPGRIGTASPNDRKSLTYADSFIVGKRISTPADSKTNRSSTKKSQSKRLAASKSSFLHPVKQPEKQNFYKVELPDKVQEQIEAYDGADHELTNETVDYLRTYIKNKRLKSLANQAEAKRIREEENGKAIKTGEKQSKPGFLKQKVSLKLLPTKNELKEEMSKLAFDPNFDRSV